MKPTLRWRKAMDMKALGSMWEINGVLVVIGPKGSIDGHRYPFSTSSRERDFTLSPRAWH